MANGDQSNYPTWFGGGVVALACDANQLRRTVADRRFGRSAGLTMVIRRGADDLRKGQPDVSGSAPGVNQTLGEPLRPGDNILLRGNVSSDTVVAIRIDLGKRVIVRNVRPVGGRNVHEVVTVKRGGRVRLSDAN